MAGLSISDCFLLGIVFVGIIVLIEKIRSRLEFKALKPEAAFPKRPWFQYSLRSLLIFMLVTGVFFGWVAKKIQEGRRQKAVVDWLGKRGNMSSMISGSMRRALTFSAYEAYIDGLICGLVGCNRFQHWHLQIFRDGTLTSKK